MMRMLSRVQAQGKRKCAFVGPGRCLARGGRWRGWATSPPRIWQENADSNRRFLGAKGQVVARCAQGQAFLCAGARKTARSSKIHRHRRGCHVCAIRTRWYRPA
ncbi:hypothetical protein PSEUDO8BK_30024 [Pseudomonas sp. 8BK]|nr:hypothetical protein PSEUDO8BK_30024 [Pseudomonas sp. 8BK]